VKVFDRLGIGEAMKAKIKPQSTGQIASAVAKGDADLAVFLTNLLAALTAIRDALAKAADVVAGARPGIKVPRSDFLIERDLHHIDRRTT
jgi:hypothetical protein